MKNAKEQRLKVRIIYLKLKSSFDIISTFNNFTFVREVYKKLKIEKVS